MAATGGPFELSRRCRWLALVGSALSLAACATAPPPTARLSAGEGRARAYNRPYQVRGRWYTPADQPGYDRIGLASWYGYESRSRTTANGEPFDARLVTAAHPTLPLPSWLEVTNLDNGRSARVRLNDRGPFASGRILDLSRGAADELGFLQRGTARVRVRYLGPAEPLGGAPRVMWAAAPSPPARVRHRASAAPRIVLAAASPSLPPVDWSGPVTTEAPLMQAPPPAAAAPPTFAQAEVDKDLADFGDEGSAASAPAAVPTLPLPDSSGSDTGYGVQAGAFADRDNAERVAAQLSQAGQAQILPLQRTDGETLYRVVVGDWPEAQAADDARARIAALGFADARVVGR